MSTKEDNFCPVLILPFSIDYFRIFCGSMYSRTEKTIYPAFDLCLGELERALLEAIAAGGPDEIESSNKRCPLSPLTIL